MQKVIDYTNWSTTIFEGFYESRLYNSESVFYLTDSEPEPPSGYCYDLVDFEGFKNEIGEEAVRLIWNNVPEEDGIILGMKFKGIDSPKYYNFTTDRIEVDVKVDYDKLKEYCLVKNREDFDKYLHENFTSRDGFWSFIHNNVEDFESELDLEPVEDDNVMVEFYLLNLDYFKENEDGNWSDYDEDIYEAAQESLWDHLALEKDWHFYSYTLSENENEIIVGDEIIF